MTAEKSCYYTSRACDKIEWFPKRTGDHCTADIVLLNLQVTLELRKINATSCHGIFGICVGTKIEHWKRIVEELRLSREK